MKIIRDFEGNEITVERSLPRSKKKKRPDTFGHLTNEERMEHACEILALGVLRLAEKRGLTVKNDP